jgi:3-oxoacyl-[acyl-carrier protein] reductase
MTDFLLKLGEIEWARKAVAAAGIPLPMPQALDREEGPIKAVSLAGKNVLVGGGSALEGVIRELGAGVNAGDKAHALVFDARGITGIDDLKELFAFFHANIRKLAANGRIVVVSRAPSVKLSAETSAASATATGFVKSVAKEIGKKGATANAIFVDEGGEPHLAGALRFLLSRRSAYVDGQAITVSATQEAPNAHWEGSLKGKVALVTGAARGIGEITARRLAEEGAKVLALDVPQAQDALEKLAGQIGGVALTLDITAPDAPAQILAAAGKLGGLHIVVNNAGITRDKTLANMSDEQWSLALAVNLKAALAISEAALAKFGTGCRVIFLSSIAGIAGNFGQTNYGSAKAGLIGATKILAPRFAEKGATVNAVAPGFIETQMTAAIPFVTREAGRRLSNLGQGGLPVDVAELITFLVSPAAAGVNGQVIRVCGGNYLGA